MSMHLPRRIDPLRLPGLSGMSRFRGGGGRRRARSSQRTPGCLCPIPPRVLFAPLAIPVLLSEIPLSWQRVDVEQSAGRIWFAGLCNPRSRPGARISRRPSLYAGSSRPGKVAVGPVNLQNGMRQVVSDGIRGRYGGAASGQGRKRLLRAAHELATEVQVSIHIGRLGAADPPERFRTGPAPFSSVAATGIDRLCGIRHRIASQSRTALVRHPFFSKMHRFNCCPWFLRINMGRSPCGGSLIPEIRHAMAGENEAGRPGSTGRNPLGGNRTAGQADG